ncbi:MAG: hypothetical protein N3A71_03035 [Candidatus Dojkabacteria bacterium]|nr:hypothetical protein [Candidatus Dojkabacteria bacterium]
MNSHGQYVNRFGRIVDVITGAYIRSDGRFIDRKGNLIDPETGEYIDEKGNKLPDQKRIRDGNGYFIDEYGYLVDIYDRFIKVFPDGTTMLIDPYGHPVDIYMRRIDTDGRLVPYDSVRTGDVNPEPGRRSASILSRGPLDYTNEGGEYSGIM